MGFRWNKKKIDSGDPINTDVYKLTKTQRREYNIRELPTSLKETLEEMESDESIKIALGRPCLLCIYRYEE